jgi:hypothetical protein
MNMAGGLLCLLIVASTYDPGDAGRIYTVLSLAGSVMFFEFGLPTLVLQRMSLLTRDAQWSPQDLVGNTVLIAPLFNHYLSLVLVQSFMLLIILLPAGLWIIIKVFGMSFMSLGSWSWIFACLAMIMSLPAALLLNTLEGLGHIKVVAKVRVVQALVSLVSLNLALYFRSGYLSIAIQLICSLIAIWSAILIFEFKFTKSLFSMISLKLISGRISLDWRLQWRLILSFLSGYFSNQAWVVMIALTGAVALAGHVAMTLQALTALAAFSLTPLAAKFSLLSALAYKDKHRDYMNLVKKLCEHTIIVFAVISSISILLYFFGSNSFIDFQTKFLQFGPLFTLGLSAPLILILSGMTMLNQSLGRDDLYIVSILRIITPLICLFFFGETISEWTFAISYVCIAALAVVLGVGVHRRSHFRIFYEN